MTAMIGVLALLVGIQGPAPNSSQSDAEIRAIIARQTTCLRAHVSGRVGGQSDLNEELRSSIRISAANACYEYDRTLASRMSQVRDGTRSLDEMTAEMVTLSLRIADGFVAAQLDANHEAARRNAQY